MTKKIGVLVGSLRQESYNKQMAKALISLAPASLTFENIEIGNLPLYNQDFDDENRPPQEWVAFRKKIQDCDGILFITPEYNRSIPGVLKNAIDVGSRPYGKSVWDGLPGAVISVSPSAIGGFGANHHLRQTFVFLNIPVLQFESYIGKAHELFDEEGNITKEDTREFLQKFINAYVQWVSKILSERA